MTLWHQIAEYWSHLSLPLVALSLFTLSVIMLLIEICADWLANMVYRLKNYWSGKNVANLPLTTSESVLEYCERMANK